MSVLLNLIRRGENGFRPERPLNFSATGARGFISLAWGIVPDDVTSVKIYVSSDGGNLFVPLTTLNKSGDTPIQTSYNHTGLGQQVTRHYYIIYTNSVGDSPKSETRFATTTESEEPTNNGFGTAYVTSVSIPDGTKYVDVTFNETITSGSGAEGVRLIGGVARVKSLVSGIGTNRLRFELDDFPLPEDPFKFIYRQQLGNYYSSTGKLNFQYIQNVNNNTSQWWGNIAGVGDTSRRVFYINTSGADGSGVVNDQTKPYRNPQYALDRVEPGDLVLCRRGQTFSGGYLLFKKNATPNKPITFAAYGPANVDSSGRETNKPIISASTGSSGDGADLGVININYNYCGVSNLRVTQTGSGRGIRFGDDYNNGRTEEGRDVYSPKATSCEIIATSNAGYAALYSRRRSNVHNWLAMDNTIVSGFDFGLRCSGYPFKYSEEHHIYGGLIENNDFQSCRTKDMTNTQRGYFHGMVFRFNKIQKWREDAMDFFAVQDLVIEFNEVCFPQTGQLQGGDGIKAGGVSGNGGQAAIEEDKGHQAKNLIVRHNFIHDLTTTNDNRGLFNNAGTEGIFYGNLIVNLTGVGIKIDNSSVSIERYDIYNNTVFNTQAAFVVDGCKSGVIYLSNNILNGDTAAIRMQNGTTTSCIGKNNILLGGVSDSGVNPGYSGTGDITGASASDVMEDPTGQSTGNYRLKVGSVGINGGSAVDGYPKDFEGKPITDGRIDVGCFEFPTAVSLANTTVWACGDSIVHNDAGGQDGWAEHLGQYLRSEATFVDKGREGRSSQDYYDGFTTPQGGTRRIWKDEVHPFLQPGHIVLLSLMHNDNNENGGGNDTPVGSAPDYNQAGTYGWYMQQMINEAENKGAIVVYVLPPHRRQFDDFTGDLLDRHGEYLDAANAIITANSLKKIDLAGITWTLFNTLGENRTDNEFASGVSDETHFTAFGANELAKMILSESVSTDNALKPYIVTNYQNYSYSYS